MTEVGSATDGERQPADCRKTLREIPGVIFSYFRIRTIKNPDSFPGFSYFLYVSSVSQVHGAGAHAGGAGPIEKTVLAKIYQNGFLDIHLSLCMLFREVLADRTKELPTLFRVLLLYPIFL